MLINQKRGNSQKVIMLIFITILCFSFILNACSSSNTTGNTTEQNNNNDNDIGKISTDDSDSNLNPPGVFPIVKEKVTLEFLKPQSPIIQDMETNEMTKFMEEKTNIHIKWTVVSNIAETKSLLLASGDLPDAFVGCSITREEEVLYGSSGVFLTLNDLIDEYGYYTKIMFEEEPSIKTDITAPGGKIYALPSCTAPTHMYSSAKVWMNTPWLKALNLKAPTTTDEFYEVLKAFKDKDPNGNGKPDEIPYTGLVTSKNWNSPIPFVMSAFITDDYDRRFVQPFDGTVDVIFNKPEWREGLMYLNRLYTDGLLDNEAFTHDRTLLTQKVENPDAPLVGAVSSNAPSTFANADTERFASYDPIAPIEGPSGLRSAAITNPSLLADGKSGHFVITNKCKNPDIAFRWADTMYDVEMNTYNIFGREGHEWRKAEPGEIGINGKPALWATITQVTGGTSQNVSWNQTVHSYRPEYWRYGEVRASEELYYKRAGMETRLYDALQLYVPYTKGPAVTFSIYIDPSKAKEYNDLKTNIYDFVYQYTSRFITGDLNLTSDWDNYLNQLDKMGLKDYIKMTQEAIDSTKVN